MDFAAYRGNEMKDLKNFKLFTHAGCMDGSAAAILFMHAGGLEKNITLVPAGKVEDYWYESRASNEYVPVLFVDIAPHTDELARVMSNRTDTFVIDHHASANRFSSLDGFHIDTENKACGSENFRLWLIRQGFSKFKHQAFERFTRIIDDHDRWQQMIPFSAELPKLFSFIGQREFIRRFYDVYQRFSVERDSYWDNFEFEVVKIITSEQNRRFNSLMSKFVKIDRDFNGKNLKIGYVLSSEINCSELLNEYLKNNQDVDVACQVNFDQNKLSLRSNGRVNITEYAGRYGGGGHANSGGHPLPDNIVARIAEMIHGQDLRR